jgi:ribosomal protein S18 acetylase RimI-like enzyme
MSAVAVPLASAPFGARVVREARRDDEAGLSALVRSVGEFSPDEVEVALELIESALAKTDDYRVLVALEHDRITGYACFGPTPMTKGAFDLYWIASAKGARGSGVGRALIDAVIESLRACGGRLLRVETSSRTEYLATRRFYERAAFKLAATLTAFYDVDDDLMIYVRYV